MLMLLWVSFTGRIFCLVCWARLLAVALACAAARVAIAMCLERVDAKSVIRKTYRRVGNRLASQPTFTTFE